MMRDKNWDECKEVTKSLKWRERERERERERNDTSCDYELSHWGE